MDVGNIEVIPPKPRRIIRIKRRFKTSRELKTKTAITNSMFKRMRQQGISMLSLIALDEAEDEYIYQSGILRALPASDFQTESDWQSRNELLYEFSCAEEETRLEILLHEKFLNLKKVSTVSPMETAKRKRQEGSPVPEKKRRLK